MEDTKCSEDYLNFFKLAHCTVRTFVSYMLLAEMQTAGYLTLILVQGSLGVSSVFISKEGAFFLVCAVGTAVL